ncbi:MAG: SDR family oxidoreductase [Bacteroidetes bacterium]|nr:SDR family oxidoreductase [Bacteroidota bacterium]
MRNFYKDKVVVVTGSSSGIGREIVEQLANYGAKIVLCARNQEAMQEHVRRMNLADENYLILALDFSQAIDFNAVREKILSKFNQIDILINNAGIAQKSLVQETNEEVERRIMEVNYFANINFTKALLPHFIDRKKGQIVGISSILGEIGLPFVGPYCASKHALNGYYNSMRYDLEKLGVEVAIVSPGFIKTEITKKSLTGSGEIHDKDSLAQEKGMSAKDCAQGILKNISKKKRQSYVGGLETLMPKFAFLFPRLFHFLMRKLHKI